MPFGALFFICQRAIGNTILLPEVYFSPPPANIKHMLITGGTLAFDFLRNRHE